MRGGGSFPLLRLCCHNTVCLCPLLPILSGDFQSKVRRSACRQHLLDEHITFERMHYMTAVLLRPGDAGGPGALAIFLLNA